MVESLGMTPQGSTKGPLRMTPAFERTVLDNVHRRDRKRPVCRPMGNRYHRHPTLRMVEKVSSPTNPLNLLMEWKGACYDPCVDRRGIDNTDILHLANAWKPIACTISELIDGVQDERGKVRRLIDGQSFGVSFVRIEFSAYFKLVSFN